MTAKNSREYYEKLEILLRSALFSTQIYLSEQDYHDVKEYIEHGEYGVGWELLWFLVNSQEITPPDDLITSGQMMGFDISVR